MKATLWGTRGSLPDAAPDTVRYGGNTSCVEVRATDGTMLILDAGSGIRRLGKVVNGLRRVDVLLTHLHIDHIVGLGFFEPLFRDDIEVHIWGPPSSTCDLGTRLSRYLSPPLFPVRLRDLPRFPVLHDVPRGAFDLGPFHIDAELVCHPDVALGYRISENGSSMAYLPDHEPALGSDRLPSDVGWLSGAALANGVDLLIHDAQYSTDEYRDHVGWGHSTIAQACEFARMTGVKRLVTFHHDPSHDDAAIDRLLETETPPGAPPFDLIPGTQGATFEF